MSWKTVKKWNALGYLIMKGSKSTRRSKKGNPQFHISQVRPMDNDYAVVEPDSYSAFPTRREEERDPYHNPNRFMPAQCCDD